MSIAVVAATQCDGMVLIHEKMFESRLFFVDKLIGMGARIVLCDPHRAVISGASQSARRAGGVTRHPRRHGDGASPRSRPTGTSEINNIGQIERGYERIDDRLRALGAADRACRRLTRSRVAGAVPLWEVPGWRERFGVTAGITGRATDPAAPFDLGLWTDEPVGQVMARWRRFRSGASRSFQRQVLAHQVHGTNACCGTSQRRRGWTILEGADGHATRGPGCLLLITVADCVPVYLVAPRAAGGGIAPRRMARNGCWNPRARQLPC